MRSPSSNGNRGSPPSRVLQARPGPRISKSHSPPPHGPPSELQRKRSTAIPPTRAAAVVVVQKAPSCSGAVSALEGVCRSAAAAATLPSSSLPPFRVLPREAQQQQQQHQDQQLGVLSCAAYSLRALRALDVRLGPPPRCSHRRTKTRPRRPDPAQTQAVRAAAAVAGRGKRASVRGRARHRH